MTGSGGRDIGPAMVRRLYEEVDFSAVLRTAVIDCGVPSPAHAVSGLEAFVQWFSLTPMAEDIEHYVMLKGDPDRVWHAAIINSVLYRHICDRYVGRFVDHHPSTATPPDVWVQETVAVLEAHFGTELHPAFREWQTAAVDQPPEPHDRNVRESASDPPALGRFRSGNRR